MTHDRSDANDESAPASRSTAPGPDPASPGPASPHSTTLIALIVAAAFFMEILDGAIIAPAIPEIAVTFRTTAVAVSSGITSYLITVAIFIPASAWLSERFGARKVFASAIALFTIASILCGLSQSLTEFTLARILQGIGGAMMSPVGRIEVLRKTEKANLLRTIAFLTWPGLSAFVVGPPVGGLLTTYLSWRWIFFINIPIGLAGIALVLIFFDRSRSGSPRRFDALGFALNGGALASLLYGIEQLSHSDALPQAIAILLAGTALGYAAIRHAVRHPAPLLSLAPLKIPSFAFGSLRGGGLFRLSAGGTGFLLPVMFQVIFGMTAFDAGLLVGCFLLGDLGIKFVANQIVRYFGFRTTLLGIGWVVAATGVSLMLIDPQTPLWIIIPLLVAAGASRSISFTAANSLVFADMPQDQIGNASTLQSMLQQVMFGAGVALAAVALAVSAAWQGHNSTALTLGDFRFAFGVGVVLALLSVLAYSPMPKDIGMHVSGRRRS